MQWKSYRVWQLCLTDIEVKTWWWCEEWCNLTYHWPNWFDWLIISSRHIKKIAKRQSKLIRLTNQAKLKSYRTRKVYQFGYLVPQNHEHAMELYCAAGNTKWCDAELLELGQTQEYKTYIDKKRDLNHQKNTQRSKFILSMQANMMEDTMQG